MSAVKFGTWEAARLVVPEKAEPQTGRQKAVRYTAEPPNGSGMSGTETSGGGMKEILKIGVLFYGLHRVPGPHTKFAEQFPTLPVPSRKLEVYSPDSKGLPRT